MNNYTRIFLSFIFLCMMNVGSQSAWFNGSGAGTPAPSPPTITTIVASPATGNFTVGQVMTFLFTFTQPVVLGGTGFPVIGFNSGGSTSGTVTQPTSSQLQFTYTVGSGQNAADLAFNNPAITLGSSTIKSAGGLDADTAFANGFNPPGSIVVDTAAPTISGVAFTGNGITNGSGNVITGTVVRITETFSEAVNVTGSPSLTLSNGAGTSFVTPVSQPTTQLQWDYTVVSGQTSSHLTVASITGTIRDPAGNNANTAGGLSGGSGTVTVNQTSTSCTRIFTATQGGSGGGDGLTVPWNSIAQVNVGPSGKFKSGDCINFNGSFTDDNLRISTTNVGTVTPTSPVIFQSTSGAIIHSTTGGNFSSAISIAGVNGFLMQGLTVRAGSGLSGACSGGVTNCTQFGVIIGGLSGGGSIGASTTGVFTNNDVAQIFRADNHPSAGYSNQKPNAMVIAFNQGGTVTISNNTVHGLVVSEPGNQGITVDNSATNVTVVGNLIFNIGGHDTENNSLNFDDANTAGIDIVNGPTNLLVTNNIIHDTAANVLGNACGASSGIEAAGTSNAIIRRNEIYNVQINSFGNSCDGDAIDLDASMTNSFVEFNYTHHSAGGGLYGCMGCVVSTWGPNTYRYNISEGDGFAFPGYFGGITFANADGGTHTVYVYGNTVYQNASSGSVPALALSNNGSGSISSSSIVANNIFAYTAGNIGVRCFTTPSGTWRNNAYWAVGAGTLQSGCGGIPGSETGAKIVNPLFVGPVGGQLAFSFTSSPSWVQTSAPNTQPAGYALQASSTLIGAGVSPSTLGAPNVGTQIDYFGNPLPNSTPSGFNIGAYGGMGGSAIVINSVVPACNGGSPSCSGIVSGSGAVITGNTVKFTVNFSSAVTVTGTPRLLLNAGGPANYSSGSGSNNIVFSYTIGSEVTSLLTATLDLNGGTIKNGTTNASTTFSSLSGNVSVNFTGATFATSFPTTETPINQSSKWFNGGTNGNAAVWGNVQTTGGTPGLAFGSGLPSASGDPVAVLNAATTGSGGTWTTNQTAVGTISPTSSQPGACCADVQVRLNTTISSASGGSITGYKFSCSLAPSTPYAVIDVWLGAPNALGTTNYARIASDSTTVCNPGDQLKATNVGGVLTLYVNGVSKLSTTDTTGSNYTGGTPGIGFWMDSYTFSSYGLSAFSASSP